MFFLTKYNISFCVCDQDTKALLVPVFHVLGDVSNTSCLALMVAISIMTVTIYLLTHFLPDFGALM